MTKPFYAGVGSRETPVPTLADMRRLASDLAMDGWRLRTGGADGADTAFERGHRDAKDDRGLEIFLPWPGYNRREGLTLDKETMLEAMTMAAEKHPAWYRCSIGAKKLHGRNTAIMLGGDLKQPVAAVVCWTREGRVTGGTGMAMRIAESRGIPIYNLATRKREDIAEEMADAMRRIETARTGENPRDAAGDKSATRAVVRGADRATGGTKAPSGRPATPVSR